MTKWRRFELLTRINQPRALLLQEPPQVHCPLLNIIPPDAKQSDPVSFEISATSDGCGEPELKLLDYECWKMNPKGKRVDKTGCSVEIEGSTVKILNSGGVGTFIGVSAMATDLDGKTTTVSTEECRLQVLRPGIRH